MDLGELFQLVFQLLFGGVGRNVKMRNGALLFAFAYSKSIPIQTEHSKNWGRVKFIVLDVCCRINVKFPIKTSAATEKM